MKEDRVEFSSEKVSAMVHISKSLASRYDLSYEEVNDDYVNDMLTAKLDAYLFAHTSDNFDLDYYAPPPSFWDWIKRRQRKFTINIKVKDFKLNPPVMPDGTLRLYFAEISPNNEES